jgi:hypothetical protein
VKPDLRGVSVRGSLRSFAFVGLRLARPACGIACVARGVRGCALRSRLRGDRLRSSTAYRSTHSSRACALATRNRPCDRTPEPRTPCHHRGARSSGSRAVRVCCIRLRRPPQSVAAKPARGALRRASAAPSSAGFEARARTRALRKLTSRRECLSVVSAANEASCPPGLETEQRRVVGPPRARPPQLSAAAHPVPALPPQPSQEGGRRRTAKGRKPSAAAASFMRRGRAKRGGATEMKPPRSLRSLPPEGALSPFGTAGRY